MSKGKGIIYNTLETQKYLKGEYNVTKDLQRRIMHLRIRDVPVKTNYPKAFKDRKCSASDLCLSEESQSHIFSCDFLSTGNQIVYDDIKFEQIFSDCVKTQETITEIFFHKFQKLKEIISSRDTRGGPNDPRKSNQKLTLGSGRQDKRNTKS